MFNFQVHLGSADNLVLLLIILVICLAIQFVVSFLWFHRHIGWTKEEAMLGAVPGAMAAILAFNRSALQKHHHKNCYFSCTIRFNRIDYYG